MSTSAKDRTAALAQARERLLREHAALHTLLDRLRPGAAAAHELPALLSELHKALAKHFAHETYPSGYYEVIGACTTELLGDIRELSDEHFLLLATTQSLRERAERGAGNDVTFEHELAALLERLAAHEEHENQLVDRVLR
jgi:hypothetical protein